MIKLKVAEYCHTCDAFEPVASVENCILKTED
jgi:hypothetical protein